MGRILVNHRNLSEVLATYGLVVLAECLGSPIKKCRFTSTATVICDDDTFRSMVFEFEHPDYDTLLQRIASLAIARVGGKVMLLEDATKIMILDWCDMGGFLGDKGNFSNADKLMFVRLHHDVFKELVAAGEDLFSLSTDKNETNYLSNMSSLKKNYIDAGGVYDSADNTFFAREFLLLIALQNFRSVMTRLTIDKSVIYTLVTTWASPNCLFAALNADVSMSAWKKMECRTAEFGNYGLVLKSGREVMQTGAAVAI